MAEAAQRERWYHTSSMLALTINLHRDPKKSKPAKPEDFNPFIRKREIPRLSGKDLTILRDIFCKGK